MKTKTKSTSYITVPTEKFIFYLYPSQTLWVDILRRRGAYQTRNLAFAIKLFKLIKAVRGRVAVCDIGANLGMNSLYFSLYSDKIYAFEPNYDVFMLLNKNIVENRIKNVSPFNLGLGNANSKALLDISNKPNDGESHIVFGETGKDTEKIRVAKLDSVLKGKTVDYIKIDVEGYEFHVLKGAYAIIKRNRPVIVLEINKSCMYRYGRDTPERIFKFLRKMGYSCTVVNSGRKINRYKKIGNFTDFWWIPDDILKEGRLYKKNSVVFWRP